MINVPSGGAALTASATMRPIAPGRFSTTTGWPRLALILSATTRAMMSAVPPGAKPTRILTGLSILSCATAGAAAIASESVNVAARAAARNVMVYLLLLLARVLCTARGRQYTRARLIPIGRVALVEQAQERCPGVGRRFASR